MEIDIEKLEITTAAIEEVKKINQELRKTASPLFEDYKKIEEVKNIIKEEMCQYNLKKSDKYVVYIFILLYCFSPTSIIGRVKNKKVLQEISKCLGLNYPNFIHKKQNILMMYKLYPNIRRIINDIYEKIQEKCPK